MTKGNGKDEAQPAGAQQQEQGQAEPVRMPVLAWIVANPENGNIGIQINDKVVTEPMDFYLGVIELGMSGARNERAKQRAGQILVPKRQIVRPPGL